MLVMMLLMVVALNGIIIEFSLCTLQYPYFGNSKSANLMPLNGCHHRSRIRFLHPDVHELTGSEIVHTNCRLEKNPGFPEIRSMLKNYY